MPDFAELAKDNKPSDTCAANYVDQLCAQEEPYLTDRLAAYLGTHSLNIHKGLGRYNILNMKSFSSWCELEPRGRLQAIAIARTPKKGLDTVKAAANREYLMYIMSDGDGMVDAGGYSAAMEQRRQLLPQEQIADVQAADQPRVAKAYAQGLTATATAWTNLSGYVHPVGRINDLLIDSDGTPQTRTMWAGADGGGIWKTTDGGTSWTPVNDFNGSLAIGKILRSPRNSLEMYASTNPYGSHTYSPYGVLKSNDGGVTWAQLAATNPVTNGDWQYVTYLAIHPGGAAGQDVLLAATNNGAGAGGVYQSSDSGATWTKISTNTVASYVGFHPTDGNRRAYALNNGTITVTTNGSWSGASTSTILAGTTTAYTKFAFAASDANIMYALVSGTGGITNFLQSTTGGSTWTALTAPANFLYNNNYLYYTGGLWVDPTNARRIALYEGWAATTPDLTTATASTGWTRSPSGWTDFHGAVADPGFNGTTNKIIYLMDDGGLYKFADVDTLAGAAYLATGMTITETFSVAGRGGNIIFGAQDVGPRVYSNRLPADATFRWNFVTNPTNGSYWIGDGATTAASRDNNSQLYGSRQFLDLFGSNDGGLSGHSICGLPPSNITEGRCSGNYGAGFVAPFVLDPNHSNTMLAGGASLWRTTNVSVGIPSWNVIFAGPNAQITAISVAPSDSNTIWIAYSNGSVYKSSNGLAATPTWSQITTVPGGSKLKIYIDRTNANLVYIGLAGFSGNKLHVSNNAGASWTPVAGLPSASVMAMEQHPANSAWLYVGTAVGLFNSKDAGATWSASNEGPANVQIRDLSWYSESSSSADLLVATFGRGVWRATVQNSLISQTISFTNPGNKTLGAPPFTLSATGGASGNPVTFTSQTTGVCTVSGSTVTLVAAGTCTIAADQAGNASYAAASQVLQSFAVNSLISQTINFTNPGVKTVGSAPFALSATGGASGNAMTFASQTTGVCTVSGSTVTLVATGTCTISANQAGNATYAAASQVLQSFSVIGLISQTISFTNPGAKTLGAAPFALSATGGASGNPVTFASQTNSVCTVSVSTVTLVAAGTCTIAADQAGNATYQAAPQVIQSFTVSAATSLAPVSPYDGIYQWDDGYFLSVHQIGGGVLIGTIYWVYNANPEQVGARPVSESDTFDLSHGQLVGSTATMTGTRFYRGCTLSYDFTFNPDSSLSVRLNSVSNSPGVSVADVNCAARYTSVGSTRTIPRIY